MAKRGFLAIVLHSHLPYVIGHGTWPHGTEWLYEAASETYIPLYKITKRLLNEGLRAGFTVGITPVLAEQLKDDRFKSGFPEYLKNKIESARDDEKYFSSSGHLQKAKLAYMWASYYEDILKIFNEINEDIPQAFAHLQEEGAIEIITSGATHGYFPLISRDESIRGQVLEGRRTTEKIFGKKPKGIWPPELAYRPSYNWKPPVGGKERMRKGLEEIYKEEGIEYFLIDHHLLKGGKAIGTYLSLFEGLKILWDRFKSQYKELEVKETTPLRPYFVVSTGKHKGAATFTREPQTALQVWSRDTGYPGDFAYLEFHKKHFPGGHRYWRITGRNVDLAEKDEYRPDWAEKALEAHSSHFVSLLQQIIWESEVEDGIIVAPYDAELFGHWWFEGPEWLYRVVKKLNDAGNIESITLGEYHDRFPPEIAISIPEGSWGEGGFHWVWLNEWTEWTWKRIYEMEDIFFDLMGEYKNSDVGFKRIMKQFARELLLLQSSDWQFLITTWSARDYAENRFAEHYDYCKNLGRIARGYLSSKKLKDEDKEYLEKLEKMDNLFEDVEPVEWTKGG